MTSFQNRNRRAYSFFHRDLAGHVRVQRTEIAEFSWVCEGEGELVVRIESFRTKRLFSLDHGMRDIIIIDPGHCRARRDGEVGR